MPKSKTELKLIECCNLELVKTLMKKLNTNNEIERQYYEKLENLRKKISKNEIVVKYDYTRKIDGHIYGRLYPNNDKNKSNYCCMDSNMRSFFAREYYQYIDLSCCHARILRDLMTHYRIDCPEMSEYVINRKEILKNKNIDKKVINEYCNDENNQKVQDSFFKKIHHCIYGKNGVFEKAISEVYFQPLWKEINNTVGEYNKKGKFISYLCQTYETFIVKKAINYFTERNITPNSYIYDGLLIKKTENIDLLNLNEFLKTDYNGVSMEPEFVFDKFEITDQFLEYTKRDIKEDLEEIEEPENQQDLNDNDVANLIIEEYKEKIIKNNGVIYIYHNNSWDSDIEGTLKSLFVKSNINLCGNPKKPPVYVKTKTSSWKHYITQINAIIKNDIVLDQDILDKETGKLPFLDGIYDLVSKKFNYYDESKIYYFSYKVKRKFPTCREKIEDLKKIILQIFNGDEESYKDVFCFISRALGKYTTDKLALNLVGERDSGKGSLSKLIQDSFKGCWGTIMSKELLEKIKSFESTERQYGFMAPVCNNLICISQELEPRAKINGTLWKTLVSGGDSVNYRTAYGCLTENNIRALCIFSSNTEMMFDQPDASKTLLVYNMPCKFVNELTGVYEGYVEIVKKPELKDLLGNKEYLDAFTFLVFDEFSINKPKYDKLTNNASELEESNIEKEQKSLKSSILELYKIDPNKKERINAASVHRKLKKINIEFRPEKIKNVLITLGVKYTSMYKKEYIGLIEKEIEEND